MIAKDRAEGVIHPEQLYTLDTFKRRLDIREATLRSARRAGLRGCYVHKRAYIYGRDWIEYVLNSEDRRNGDSVSDNA